MKNEYGEFPPLINMDIKETCDAAVAMCDGDLYVIEKFEIILNDVSQNKEEYLKAAGILTKATDLNEFNPQLGVTYYYLSLVYKVTVNLLQRTKLLLSVTVSVTTSSVTCYNDRQCGDTDHHQVSPLCRATSTVRRRSPLRSVGRQLDVARL